MKTIRTLLAIALSLATFASAPLAMACGPFFDVAVFHYDNNPDFPLKLYAGGKLGIVQPTFARSYLVVAYRYFSGAPLTVAEQKSAVDMWNYRLGYGGDDTYPAIDQWKAARKLTGLKDPEFIDAWRPTSYKDDAFQQYLNCPSSAFINAANTLKERIKRYGAKSPAVIDWVKAQDQVFLHCPGPGYDYNKKKVNPEPAFPAALTGTSDPLLLADRAYQIAAAHFYAANFDKAQQEFEKIAQDANSPWRNIAPYLALRSMIRKATLSDPMDVALLEKARQVALKLMSEPTQADRVKDICSLIGFIDFKSDPPKQLGVLAERLVKPGESKDFQSDLYDYTTLIDNYTGDTDYRESLFDYAQQAKEVKSSELTDWLITYQSTPESSFKHALERYHAAGSLPWLVVALTKVKATVPEASQLMNAAQKVSPDSPAYLTLNYQLVKLLKEQGKDKEADTLLAKLLQMPLPPSAVNLLQDERLPLLRTFPEFVKVSYRTPASVSASDNAVLGPDELEKANKSNTYLSEKPAFTSETSIVINYQLPLTLLSSMALDPTIPQTLRNDLAQMVFARSIMLGDNATALKMVPTLKAGYPVLAASLESWAKATNPEQKKFLAVLTMLRSPGMSPYVHYGVPRREPINRIDDYQDNWWCAGAPATESPEPKLIPVRFLSPTESELAKKQNAALKVLETGANYLSKQAIAYAKTHQTDPNVPEALALAVKSTRFGCTDGATTNYSKEAFQILHRRYPANPWTAKTKYHY